MTGEVTFNDKFYTKHHFVYPKVSIKKDGEKITFSAEKEWELKGAKKDYLAEDKMTNANKEPRKITWQRMR